MVPFSESILDKWITRQSEANWLFYWKHYHLILFIEWWALLNHPSRSNRWINKADATGKTNELKFNRCQFHQRFTYKFLVRTLFRQLFSSYMYVEKRRSYQKFVHFTLMKLTTGRVSLRRAVVKTSNKARS